MYRRLLSNTVLFSVSTFGSKILLFLLTPFYTSILTDAEYGVTDLIIQTGNVLIPLVSMGIINAVLRFGLDETTDLKGLFTTGLVVILVGEGVLPQRQGGQRVWLCRCDCGRQHQAPQGGCTPAG